MYYLLLSLHWLSIRFFPSPIFQFPSEISAAISHSLTSRMRLAAHLFPCSPITSAVHTQFFYHDGQIQENDKSTTFWCFWESLIHSTPMLKGIPVNLWAAAKRFRNFLDFFGKILATSLKQIRSIQLSDMTFVWQICDEHQQSNSGFLSLLLFPINLSHFYSQKN